MEERRNLKEQIHRLIAENDIERAFELLAANQFTRVDKELILLNNRYNKVREERRMGVLSKVEADQELNKITAALIDLSSQIESKPLVFGAVAKPENQALYYIIPVLLLALAGGAYWIFVAGDPPPNPEGPSVTVQDSADTNEIVEPEFTKEIEDKVWNLALQQDELENYEAYLDMFPSGTYLKEAKQRILEFGEAKVWLRAKDKDIVEFYEDYLDQFPDGQHADAAIRKIASIQAEELRQLKDDEDFEAATKTNTVQAFQEYLTTHPEGEHRVLAEANIKALKVEKKCLCPPKTFRTVSDLTWAEFRMPKAQMGSIIRIPGGDHSKYKFPKNNRTWWTNLTFTCDPNSCRWKRIGGEWDSDAGFGKGYTKNKYLFVGYR